MDDANYALAQDVLAGRFKFIEEGIADPSGDGPMIAAQPEGVDDAAAGGTEPVRSGAVQ